jgi:predicted ester cyclase
VDDLHAANFAYHGPGGVELKGRAEAKEYVRAFRAAFPDVRVTTENMVAEGDYVADRTIITGTHRGDFQGIAPTGKRVTVVGNALNRFAGDKQVEVWMEFDTLGLMQQLGVIPPTGQPGK